MSTSTTVEMHYPGVANSVQVPKKRVERYKARGWSDGPVPDGDASELKGKALDDALEAAGLPTSGKVAEKRARLAAHHAGDGEDPDVEPDEA